MVKTDQVANANRAHEPDIETIDETADCATGKGSADFLIVVNAIKGVKMPAWQDWKKTAELTPYRGEFCLPVFRFVVMLFRHLQWRSESHAMAAGTHRPFGRAAH